MIMADFFGFLAFVFIVFLLLKLIWANLFFSFLVQLKEYRLDRLLSHFKTLSGKQDLKNNFNLIKLRKIVFPQLTGKIILILALVFFLEYNLFFSWLKVFYHFLDKISYGSLIAVFLVLILFVWLAPVFLLMATIIVDFLIWPIKFLLFQLAAKKRARLKKLLVIGITGSYGKTITKEIISWVLKDYFKVLKTPLNCNTRLGIALLILKKLNSSHQILVVEMGAYKKGEIRAICQMVKPQIGIITGINAQHLELFGSLAKIIQAKYELIQSLPKKNSLALFNANNKLALKLAGKRKIKTILYPEKKANYKLKIRPEWYQESFQAALAVAVFLGKKKNKIIRKWQKLTKFPFGLSIKKKLKAIIINDSYSSNPTGVLSLLDFIKSFSSKPKVLVMPGIIELGLMSDKIHYQIGQKAGLVCDKIILTKKDFYQPISKGLKKVKSLIKLEIIEDHLFLLNKIKNLEKKGSLILLAGRVPQNIRNYYD